MDNMDNRDNAVNLQENLMYFFSDYESVGREFESLQARQKIQGVGACYKLQPLLLFVHICPHWFSAYPAPETV